MALQGPVEKDCRHLWPGKGGGSTVQNGWIFAASNTFLFYLNTGRNGRDEYCRGGVHVRYLQHRDKRPLVLRPVDPPSNKLKEAEERQKAETEIESSGSVFLKHFLLISATWGAGAGTSMFFYSCGEVTEPSGTTIQVVELYFSYCSFHVRSLIVACPYSDGKTGETGRRSGRMSYIRTPSDQPHVVKWYESQTVFGDGVEDEIFQIFIKMLSGKTTLVWVSGKDTGDTLKTMIAQREGRSQISVYIMYGGKILNEGDRLKDCQISKNSTLHVRYRLRGGSIGNKGTAGPSSCKDAARAKGPQTSAAQHSSQPKPYIVEKLDDIPSLEVKNTEVTQLFSNLQTHALICRFNGFWPRSYDLHNWIYTNWSTNCQILLCSKGFFVVQFESKEEYEKIIEQGPWFWGRAGLFLTPWFLDFDANTMVVTKMPVWVRLPNLPLPFWHHLVLEDIGNLLGKYIKRDTDRHEQGLFTYARICVEIDLSKGLPDRIKLIYEKHKWIQALDYENTAFRCRFCHLTGHLQDSCPLAKRHPKKNQGMKSKGKTWQADYAPPTNEDSESEESEPEEKHEKEINEEIVHKAETVETHHSDSKHAGKETLIDNMQFMANSLTGSKRAHESENSDSDKEKTSVQSSVAQASKELIVAVPQHGEWTEVKTKKREKKGKLEDYYKSPNF